MIRLVKEKGLHNRVESVCNQGVRSFEKQHKIQNNLTHV